MKLLLDQNLSHRLVKSLAGKFPGSSHVRDENLATASDSEVWSHAANNGFVIVSKDMDFQQMAIIRGAPPKVIRLRIGNCTTDQIGTLLLDRSEEIEDFVADNAATCLVLS